jgi:lipopolysaccharide transport system ATP-binding protein
MAARLAFAAATAVEPAVLVVDEALAVGDAAFQKKCVDRMIELKEAGRTILFCSHSLYLVTSFCERALWLREGKVAALGEAREVVEAYERYLAKKRQGESPSTAYQAPTERTGLRPRLVRFSTEPPVDRWEPGQPLQLVLELEVPQGSRPYHLGASLDAMDERCVFLTTTHWQQIPPLVSSGRFTVHVELLDLPLGNGQFWVNGFVLDDTGMVVWDRARLGTPLWVPGNRWDPSLVRIPHRWRLP